MTYLGLDIGERRTGVAISDPTGFLARPLGKVPGGESAAQLATRLLVLLQEHEVDGVVIGLPRRMGGEHGPEAERIEVLAAQLRELLPVPIALWDERLTTVEANRLMIESGMRRKRRKASVDQIAATIILQGYLDSLPARVVQDGET